MKIKRNQKLLLISFTLAIAITLASGLLRNTLIQGVFPNLVFGGEPLMGMSYYGYPVPWLKQGIYPGAAREIIWFIFILSTILRTIILFFILKFLRKKKLINL